MVKILFIIGTHPTESYSTLVALHTARALRKTGVEVVIAKHPFEKTRLGHIFKNKHTKVVDPREQFEKERTTIRSIIAKENPLFTFNFHCTPSNHLIWITNEEQLSGGGKHSTINFDNPTDFIIEYKLGKNYSPNEFLVEIRAAYRKFPSRAETQINKSFNPSLLQSPAEIFDRYSSYLTIGTSAEESATNLGLDPRRIGNTIAKQISSNILTRKDFREPFKISGITKRNQLSRLQWRAKNKRRRQLLTRLMKK